jgi:hypothetical protein
MQQKPTEPAAPIAATPDAELQDACDALQRELDMLLGGEDAEKAVRSLDNAVASLREVEQRNVSTVQLVAL